MTFLTSDVNYNSVLEDALSSAGSGSIDTTGIFSSWEAFGEFLKSYQIPLTLILMFVSLALIVAIFIYRHIAKRPPDPLKALGVSGFIKFVSAVLICLLLASDVFAMYNMFSSFRLKWEESAMFSFTFALFLEGFPFTLGIIDPIKKDPGQFIMHRDKHYRKLSRICWCFLIVSWALAFVIRFMYTEQPHMGGFFKFWEGEYNSERNKYSNNSYLAQVFLYISPILTSLLAYALSYLSFRSSCLQEATKLVRTSQDRYNRTLDTYERINNRRQDATAALWASLTGDITSVPPLEFNDFRNQSMVYMHDMLISGCLDSYPALLKRYNHEVEAALSHYIAELSQLSTIPQRINQITVEEIIKDYDQHMIYDADKWDYELCGSAMCKDLEQLLEDAVLGSQFNTMSKK